MSLSDVMLSCPHCRREYRVSIDLAKLARVTSRAACARCKKIFDVTPDRIRGLEATKSPLRDSVRQAGNDARRDVRVDRTSRPPPFSQISPTSMVPSDPPAAVEAPPDPVKITFRTPAAAVIEERNRAAEDTMREHSPLAMPRTLSARLTSRTRSREALAPAPPPTPAQVSEAPVVDPDSDWLLRADPGLAALTMDVGESVAALQWLLER